MIHLSKKMSGTDLIYTAQMPDRGQRPLLQTLMHHYICKLLYIHLYCRIIQHFKNCICYDFILLIKCSAEYPEELHCSTGISAVKENLRRDEAVGAASHVSVLMPGFHVSSLGRHTLSPQNLSH